MSICCVKAQNTIRFGGFLNWVNYTWKRMCREVWIEWRFVAIFFTFMHCSLSIDIFFDFAYIGVIDNFDRFIQRWCASFCLYCCHSTWCVMCSKVYVPIGVFYDHLYKPQVTPKMILVWKLVSLLKFKSFSSCLRRNLYLHKQPWFSTSYCDENGVECEIDVCQGSGIGLRKN